MSARTNVRVTASHHALLSGAAERIGITQSEIVDMILSQADVVLSELVPKDQFLLGCMETSTRTSSFEASKAVSASSTRARRFGDWAKVLRLPTTVLFHYWCDWFLDSIEGLTRPNLHNLPPTIGRAVTSIEREPYAPRKKETE